MSVKPRRRKATVSEIEKYNELLKFITKPGERAIPGKDGMEISKREEKRREKLAKIRADKALSAVIARKRAQSRYYKKNKDKLNRERALRDRTDPRYAYRKAQYRAGWKDQEFNLTFDEWISVWENTRSVPDPETGFLVRPWAKRGADSSRCAQMVRIDTEKPWEIGNVRIEYCGSDVSRPGTNEESEDTDDDT